MYVVDPSLFYDPFGDFRGKDSYLPLLDQQGKLQFVTFRCIDSIPAKRRQELIFWKQNFEKFNPKPWSKETIKTYRGWIGKREEELLHNGYGKCLLRKPEIRNILDDCLLYFNKKRFDLHSYVLMPNHVHMLLVMVDKYIIEDTIESIKRFTGRLINKLSGERGKFWDGQNYCRLIRNQDHYEYTRNYINKNPVYLRRGEFTLRNFK